MTISIDETLSMILECNRAAIKNTINRLFTQISHSDIKIDEVVKTYIVPFIQANGIDYFIAILHLAAHSSENKKIIHDIVNSLIDNNDISIESESKKRLELILYETLDKGKMSNLELQKSAEWLRKAAENGIPWANVKLFDVLWNIGTPESCREMIEVIKPLAEAGDSRAIKRLNKAYNLTLTEASADGF